MENSLQKVNGIHFKTSDIFKIKKGLKQTFNAELKI